MNPSRYLFFRGDKPRIIGHRGAMGAAPENTLASFQKAVDDGALFLELDVHGSSDGEAIIIHDETVDRTTDGHGRVRDKSLKELKALDAGYRFSPDGGRSYPSRGRRLEIPTLEEFFAVFPTTRAIVELKQRSPSIIERVIGAVRALRREEQVLLATEDDEIMRVLRRELATGAGPIATGFAFGEVAAFYEWATREKGGNYDPPGQALQIPTKYRDLVLVTQETVGAAHALGLELFVWTVNDAEEMTRLLGLGVDGIITDYPARLSRVLGREQPA